MTPGDGEINRKVADPVQVGAALRRARKSRFISAKEIAFRLNLSGARITQIEKGRGETRLSGVANYCSAIGMSIDDLLKSIK
jgi:transcriptional regulator with XRE-family HTH domain